MRLVVDANILFSFFRKESFTRKFIDAHPELELYSTEKSLEELMGHKEDIKARCNIDEVIFELQ